MARRSTWRDHGLSLTFAGLALSSLTGHAWAGLWAENQERALHALPSLELGSYLRSGAFVSSLLENWESEFLQMALFVVLTVRLRQRGSAESKPLGEPPPTPRRLADAPWPVQRGGLVGRLYAHSLSLALFTLFALSFVGHWLGSYHHYVEEQRAHAGVIEHGLAAHLVDSQFWFESFQNWQSEFLSIAALVVLTIFLREEDSAQSKDVAAPHAETGA